MNVRFPAMAAAIGRPLTFARQRLGPVQRFADGREVRQQYVAHDGRAARLRRLRQLTRGLHMTVDQVARFDAWFAGHPPQMLREPAYLFRLNLARELAEQTAQPFTAAMDRVLDRLEREASEAKAS